ncbi:bifunctional UDP-sugar hydrolase/5'-nucleotidase [Neobacillus niacini]|uniref:bifunctional metallophosphatase/5'-nucleotidase n=1 Tax=Neobacillus niacini TaxID=86668 RepID=UPI002FFFB219
MKSKFLLSLSLITSLILSMVSPALAESVPKSLDPSSVLEEHTAQSSKKDESLTIFKAEPIDVQLLAITDFHGYLAPTTGADAALKTQDGQTLTVGGAAYLSTQLNKAGEGQQNSIRVSNGDNFSGWPWQTMFSRDEPTVEFLNYLGIDVSSAGNHELDISLDFLTSHMMDGECFGEVGVDSCFETSSGEAFAGMDFPVISSNIYPANGSQKNPASMLPSTYVQEVTGADGTRSKVGFIGVTAPDSERIFSSYQVDQMVVGSMLPAVNRAADDLQRKGVEAIVVLAHEGDWNSGTYNECAVSGGPLNRLASQASSAIDVVVGGHWHSAANCVVQDPDGSPRPVITPGHHGRTFGDIRFQIDPANADIDRASITAENIPVTRDVPADPTVAQMVDHWNAVASARWAQPLGTLAEDVTATKDADGESEIGNLVADAYLDIAQGLEPKNGTVDLAITHPRQVRNPLIYNAGSNPSDSNGIILFGESWTVQGSASSIVTISVKGKQLRELFEQQWQLDQNSKETYVPLSVSGNVNLQLDPWLLHGVRVTDLKVNGKDVKDNVTYRVAVPSRIALGMDGFTALKSGTDPVRSDMDHWAFQDWMSQQDTISAPELGRVNYVVTE